MAFFLKIGYFARFDIQKDMQQDTLYFCAGIALCFDELNDIRQVVAGVNGMQNTVPSGFASAAAIRRALEEGQTEEAFLHLPENTHELYRGALESNTAPVSWDGLALALHYRLRMMSAEEIRDAVFSSASRCSPSSSRISGAFLRFVKMGHFALSVKSPSISAC